MNLKNKHHLLVIIICCLGLFFKSSAQTTGFDFQLEKASLLHELIDQLESEYAVEFAYSAELGDQFQFDAQGWKAETMDQLIREILAEKPVEFQFSGPKKVLLRAKRSNPNIQIPNLERISGNLIDAKDGQGLAYVTISMDSSNTTVYSDLDGRFSMKIPASFMHHSLVFQYLGYQTKVIPIREIRKENTIALELQQFSLREVLIEPTGEKEIESRSFYFQLQDLATLKSNSIYGSDINRSLQMLPGIAAHDDSDASLQIRGSEGDETLIVLDGIPIQKADHFYGIFSSINSYFVEDLALYKNAFPIEYGGKTGGLLLMEGEDRFDQLHADLDLNLLNASAQMSIPLTKSIGVQFAGRTTYSDASENPLFASTDQVSSVDLPFADERNTNRDLLFSTNPDFRFYDTNASIQFKISEQSSFEVNGFRAWDRFNNAYDLQFQSGRPPMARILNIEQFQNRDEWTNTGFSSRLNHEFDSGIEIDGIGYWSRFENKSFITSELERQGPMDTFQLSFSNRQFNRSDQYGAKLNLSWPVSMIQQWKFGVQWEGFDNEIRFEEDSEVVVEADNQANSYTGFLEYQTLFHDRLQIQLGSRLSFFDYPADSDASGDWFFSPRLQLQYALPGDWFIKASMSRNYQFQRALYYENRFGQSTDFFVLADGDQFPFRATNHFMLGLRTEQKTWALDVEIFHKEMDGLIEIARVNNGFNDQQVGPSVDGEYALFTGTGRSTGIDVLLTNEWGNYSSWLAYTLSRVTNQYPEIRNNRAFAAQNDRRHQLKWLNNYKMKKFEWSGTWVYSSGRPYTDVSQLDPDQDRRLIDPRNRQDRLPAYWRIDLGLDYHFKIKNTRAQIGVSVFNLTDRDNVRFLQFIYGFQGEQGNDLNEVLGTQTNLLPRTYNLNLRFEW